MIGVWKEATNRDIKSPLSDTKSFDFRKPLEKFEAEITVKDNTEFDPRKSLDMNEKISNELLTTEEERMKHTPRDGVRGHWTGERGNSRFIPDENSERGKEVKDTLEKYGLDGIEYKDGVPDFSECSEETVEIGMTENRSKNFSKANAECAKKWNECAKDGKTDWTANDVREYMKDHNLTWHECPDCKTCQMVPRNIHSYYTHSGGVAECKKNSEVTVSDS